MKDYPEVATILDLKRDKKSIDDRWRTEINSESYLKVFSSDTNRQGLLKKFNDPYITRDEILTKLSDSYQQEISERTTTNKTWQNYLSWNNEARSKNRFYQGMMILSFLAGAGFLCAPWRRCLN